MKWTVLNSKLEQCIQDVRRWLLRWQLKINDDKTEFIVFQNTASVTSRCSVNISGSEVSSSDKVRDLGVILNNQLTCTDHVSSIVKSCNFYLRQLSRIRPYIDNHVCKRAVHALILSRVDYCNSLLAEAPQFLLHKLQKIQNRAARVVLRPRVKRGVIVHCSPLLQELSWLPIRPRIMFKICVLVYKCLHGSAPGYLSELLQHHTRDSRLRQPTENELNVPRVLRKVGATSFSVAGPVYWNTLPEEIRRADDLLSFRRALKTFLWRTHVQ